MELFHLFARLSLDRQRFDADVKAAQQTGEQAAQQVGSAWQRAGQTIEDSLRRARPASNALLLSVTGLVAGFTAAAGAAVKFNGELEQTSISFETLLGSAERARQFIQELSDFAARTPFEFPGLVTASQRLLAMGFTAEQIIPTMRAVGDAVAALGAGQEGIDRVTLALGQMLARGKVASQEMMQLTEAGIPAWDILAQKIGVSVPEAMDLVSKGAVDARTAIDALVAGMEERFAGMMERQSRSFLGLLSTIKDTLRLRAGEAFEPLFDAAKRWGQRLAEFVQSARFEQMVEGLRDAVERFVAFVEGTAQRLEPFGRWLSQHADVVIPALTGAIVAGLIPALYGLASAFIAAAAPLAPWMAAGAALGVLLALLTRRSQDAAAAHEDYRKQAERNIRALDEQARKIGDELQQLDRLLPVVEELGRKKNRTAEETRQLEGALKALQERYPWVRTEVATTGETFDGQIQALSTYRSNLRGMLQDIVQAKELIARLTLPQLERDLARAQQELAAAREEAARLVQLQGVRDPFRMADILQKAGVQIDKSKGLFGTFSDYVQQQADASAKRLSSLSQRVQDLTAQINELKQAQRDALTFRTTGQLPSRSAASTPAPAAPPAVSAQAVELPPVLSVREAVQAAAQGADTITLAFWEGIKAGLTKRGATPAEVAEALAALLDSGRAMSDELRAQLEEEYRALLPQVTQGAVSLAQAQSTAFRAEAQAGMEQAVRDSAPWQPDADATRKALEEADRAGHDQAGQFVDGLLAGLRARGATAQEITQVIADLLNSGLDMSDETRQMLERTYEDLLPEATAWAVRLAKAQGDAQRQAFEDWQADYQRHEEEKTRIAREAWTLRYQLQADAARSADQELAGIERLQVERGRKAEADRYAALADYYAKAEDRAREAAQRQQEYEDALFRWRKAIGDTTVQDELERDRKRLESLDLTTTRGMMALETFYESWAQRIGSLKDAEKQALAEQLRAWLEVYGEDSPIAQTVEALLDRIAGKTEETTDRMTEAFKDFAETVAREMEGRFGQWVDALTGSLSKTKNVVESVKAAFLDFTKWFLVEVIKRILVASGVLEVAAAAAQSIAAALMSWNPFAIAAAVVAAIGLIAWINSQLAALGAGGGGGGGAPAPGDSAGGGRDTTKERGGGAQVSEITGPTRDLLTDLLTPLASLQVLQGTGERVYAEQVVTNAWLSRIYGAVAGVDAASPDLSGIGAGAEATVAAIREQGSILHADLRELIDVARGPLAVYPAPGSPPFPVSLDQGLRTGRLGSLDEVMARMLQNGLRGVGLGR